MAAPVTPPPMDTTSSTGGALTRDLTGECGSLRYMAPEVANSLPYNHLADVFSWADVLWQMCAHRRPFLGLDEETFRKAILDGYRPPLRAKWPDALKAILTDCWHPEIPRRPEFASLLPRLDALCAELQGSPRLGAAAK